MQLFLLLYIILHIAIRKNVNSNPYIRHKGFLLPTVNWIDHILSSNFT